MGGLGGLLKGNYMQALLEQRLPVSTIEEARIPVGVTAWYFMLYLYLKIGGLSLILKEPQCVNACVVISCFDREIFGFRTRIIQSGDLATAIRASCCFPGLFQPVSVEGTLCIDGGVFDKSGMMALPVGLTYIFVDNSPMIERLPYVHF